MSKAVIIGIALASNIGGMLSPIASPQNVIAMGIMQPAPTWLQWLFIVIPVGIVSIFFIWILLLITFQPGKGTTISPIRPLREKFTGVQWFVSIVTIATIVLWCASHQMEDVFGDMGVIAIIPIVLFFGIGILTKEDFNNFPWTIIILAAGGLSLGKAVRSSGLLHTLAELVSKEVEGMGVYGILVVFSSLILVIATFISHTVAALIFLPLVFDVGSAMGQPHPNLLVMGGVLMCSAAMGLPTSGFPNMSKLYSAHRPDFKLTSLNSCDHEGRRCGAKVFASQALYQPRCPEQSNYFGCSSDIGLRHHGSRRSRLITPVAAMIYLLHRRQCMFSWHFIHFFFFKFHRQFEKRLRFCVDAIFIKFCSATFHCGVSRKH
jgi:phosphate transporter